MTLAITSQAQAASTLLSATRAEEFAKLFKDVEDPSVPAQVRKSSDSIATMGLPRNARIKVKVPQDFWQWKVLNKVRSREDSMKTFFRGEYAEGGEHFLLLPTHNEWMIPVFQELGFSARFAPFDQEFSDPVGGFCSGFLVGDDVLMTNNHCIATQQKCDIATFRFKEQRSAETGAKHAAYSHRCSEIIFTDAYLDVTLVRLEGSPGEKFGSLPLVNRDPVLNEDRLFVVSHPHYLDSVEAPELRYLKKISGPCSVTKRAHRVESAMGNFAIQGFHVDLKALLDSRVFEPTLKPFYQFDTACASLGGSSGSPVLDSTGRKVLGVLSRGSDPILEEPESSATPVRAIIEKYRHALERHGVEIEN